MTDLKRLSGMLQAGDMEGVRELTGQALEEGVEPEAILSELIAGLDIVGDRFKKGEIFLPEMLVAGRAMQGALDVLRPRLAETGAEPVGRAIVGTVKGDVHDIGKNMFGMMLEGAGFVVKDLGFDVPTQTFVEAVKEEDVQVLGMSALLSTTVPEMRIVIDALREAGLRDKVKVLVGGAPVTQRYADEIGADGYGVDAATGSDRARELIGKA
jgi:5-methyltetrahydrofolate--homocysteine methyltransferase